MDLNDTPEQAAFRAKVRAWLDAHKHEAPERSGSYEDAAYIAARRAWQGRLAEAILVATDRQLPFVERPTAVGDDPGRRCPDITKVRTLVGWEPEIPLDEGLRRTIPFFEHALKSITGTDEPALPCLAHVAA